MMLLSGDFDIFESDSAGKWATLHRMLAGGGAYGWTIEYKVGVLICLIALVIAAIMFFFTNDIKEIGQNKLNITQKFCLIVAFLSLVGLVTLFQTSISPN